MPIIIFKQEQQYGNGTFIVQQVAQTDSVPRVAEQIHFGAGLSGACDDVLYKFKIADLDIIKIEIKKIQTAEYMNAHHFDMNYTQFSFVQGIPLNSNNTHILVSNPSALLGNEHREREGFFYKKEDGSISTFFDTDKFKEAFPTS